MFTDAAGTLTGIKFNTQKISFTVGVYWISEEHYRRLIYWLNPYSIGALVFDFEPMWHYNVKLSGMKDSMRKVIGYENSYKEFNPDGDPITIYKDKPMYYTELTLDFELQGAPQAKYNIPYDFVDNNVTIESPAAVRGIWADVTSQIYPDPDDAALKKAYETYLPVITSSTTGNIPSDLGTAFSVSLPLRFKANTNYTADLSADLRILLEAVYDNGTDKPDTVTLMDMTLQRLALICEEISVIDPNNATFDENNNPINATPSQSHVYTFSYNSADGLAFLRVDGEEDKLLTKLQTLANGQRIVKTLSTNQFKMPGTFDYPTFSFNKFSIRVTFSGNLMGLIDLGNFLQNQNNADTILMYASTNLI